MKTQQWILACEDWYDFDFVFAFFYSYYNLTKLQYFSSNAFN